MRRPESPNPRSGPALPNKVLVVDDDPFVGTVVHGVLNAAGVTDIKVCASGQDALKVVIGFQPDLIILDFVMPGMNGRATWQAIGQALREQRVPMPPVIFMTARDEADIGAEIADTQAAGFIGKPFDPPALAGDIARIWAQRIQPRQTAMKLPAAKARRLAAVGEAFNRSLESTAVRIESHWNQIRAEGWGRAAAEGVLTDAHSLAGSAGLFGRHGLGGAAADVERLLLNTLNLDRAPTGAEMRNLNAAVTALITACRAVGE